MGLMVDTIVVIKRDHNKQHCEVHMSDAQQDEAARYFEGLDQGRGTEPTAFERLLPHGRRPCPFCANLMTPEESFGVTTDVCPQHGRWFDADQWELYLAARGSRERRVVKAAIAQGAETARNPLGQPGADPF
jgi:Zn-finger nucleic acid-binding protein